MPTLRRYIPLLGASFALVAAMAPAMASARPSAEKTGGVAVTRPAAKPRATSQPDGAPVARVSRAKLVAGRAVAPPDAPPPVVAAIAAANEIVDKPYRYGGGHRSFLDTGYDCSGSISHALGGAGLLKSPLDSRSFARWGEAGRGTWITVYTNPSHAYVVIASLRFDTSGSERDVVIRGGLPGSGPRWRPRRSPIGYVARHPVGL